MSHKGIKLIKINVFKALRVSSIWLKAQNLNQVFWKFLENTSLKDSGMSVFSPFPLNLGIYQSSFDMVAKLVSETSEDAEIILPVNMIQADQVPAQGRPPRVLTPEEVRASLFGLRGEFRDVRQIVRESQAS